MKKTLILLIAAMGFVTGLYFLLQTRLRWPALLASAPTLRCTDCDKPFHDLTTNGKDVARANASESLSSLLDEGFDSAQISLLVDKSNYRLTLFHQKKAIKEYPIVLGGNPTGDKQQEGDKKTPEGVFRIRDQYPHPTWSKFIWLDYPTSNSWRKHRQAKRDGEISPNATIGGEIGIHGVPEGADDWIDQKQNWTLGCIALKNSDVNEIYAVVGLGSVVEIVP